MSAFCVDACSTDGDNGQVRRGIGSAPISHSTWHWMACQPVHLTHEPTFAFFRMPLEAREALHHDCMKRHFLQGGTWLSAQALEHHQPCKGKW